MQKHERVKHYRLKALKETSIIVTISLVLFFIAIKLDNSIIASLLSNLGLGVIIIGLILFLIWYLVVYIINYIYGEMDLKAKKLDK